MCRWATLAVVDDGLEDDAEDGAEDGVEDDAEDGVEDGAEGGAMTRRTARRNGRSRGCCRWATVSNGESRTRGSEMNVQSILSVKGTQVATISPTASLAEATATLRDRGFGALVVSASGSTIDGIISERDIVRALAAHGASTLGRSVSSCMSGNVLTCTVSDTIDALMSMMTERRIRHLPVVDASGQVAGMISIGDVVKFRLGELERENDQLHNYIQGNVQ